jgi:hypothetical protein
MVSAMWKTPAPLLFSALLSLAAFGCSSSNGPAVMASATIGPAGGELLVADGEQAGLKLVVPAGAVSAPTEFRIVQVTRTAPIGSSTPAFALMPGEPFRIEPESLRLDVLGTLEAPYRLQAIQNTAAGNVRFEQLRDGITRTYEPATVDIVAGRVSMPIRTLGRYQVVFGPRAQNLDEYRPALDSVVTLEGGYTFAVEPVPDFAPAAFRTGTAQRWRIRGPGVDDSIYVDGDEWLGRESSPPGWVEVWANRALVWQDLRGQQPFTVTTPMTVNSPVQGNSSSGLMTVFGTWNWSEPRFVGPRQLFDVLQLSVTLAWDRQDIGTGQRAYRFLLAPGQGLIGLVQDSITYARTVL